jgi:TonB family protein
MLFPIAFVAFAFLQAGTSPPPINLPPSAQPPGPADLVNTPTPTDPRERLALGQRLNNLVGPDVQPWHLKASYEVFDENGKSIDKGAFEEWWVSEKKYKLGYQGAEFSQEEYGTDHGMLHSGQKDWPSGPLSFLRRTIEQPIPSKEDLDDWGQLNLERKFGTAQLPCTALSYHGGKEVSERSASFCFEPTKAILLYSNSSDRINQTTFAHFFLFQDRYVARDRRLLFLGNPALSIHVDTLETLNPPDQANVSPPGNALPVARRVELSSVESDHYLMKEVMPEYPVAAKMQGVQGRVILAFTISRDGRVTEVRVLAGPQLLQKAAEDAVRQWLFKPYLLGGEAVEVETEAQVIFNLGSR